MRFAIIVGRGDMMEFQNKAILEKKKRIIGITIIALLGAVGCVAFIMAIYSLIIGSYVYVLAYLVACIFSVVYTIIKINSVIPTFIGNDELYIYLRYWENGFFPFRTDKGFIGEFIPEKVKNSKIAFINIKSVSLGSAKYIAKANPEGEFSKVYGEYRDKYSGMLKHSEIFLVTLTNGVERYMAVDDFDMDALSEVIRAAKEGNPEIEVLTSHRLIKKKLEIK